jgi:hypothetical protein
VAAGGRQTSGGTAADAAETDDGDRETALRSLRCGHRRIIGQIVDNVKYSATSFSRRG